MTPRLVSVYFGTGDDQYQRLAQVLRYTARRWAPGWDVSVRRIGLPEVQSSQRQSAADNSWKLEYWTRAVEEAPDDTVVLLVDTDTFIAAPLDPLLGFMPFDLAYTYRNAARFPLNGGVVAARACARTRAAFREWLAEDRLMLKDPVRLEPFRRFYGGQNQASFGALLERGAFRDLSVLRLPCVEWNCEETGWDQFQEGKTRIVHVKAALRAHVFGLRSFNHTRDLALYWRRLERQVSEETSHQAPVFAL